MLCYNMIKDSASGIIYGQYKKKDREERIIGRPKSLSIFEEFTLVMMRLRLGLFEKDLGHRFGISESTVSTIFHAWIHFYAKSLKGLCLSQEEACCRRKCPKFLKSSIPKQLLSLMLWSFVCSPLQPLTSIRPVAHHTKEQRP